MTTRKRAREEDTTQRVRRERPTGEPPRKIAKKGITHSILFQVPLEKRDIRAFTNPLNQGRNPMNCGAVSTQLLRIIPKALSEHLSVSNTPTSMNDWLAYMNIRSKNAAYYIPDASPDATHAIDMIRENLFEGFATLVGVTRVLPSGQPGVGHFFVLASLRPGLFYLLDPQVQFSTNAAGISKYLHDLQLNGEVVVVLTSDPHTRQEFDSDYIDHFLPDLLTSECSIKGGKRRRTMRRLRK